MLLPPALFRQCPDHPAQEVRFHPHVFYHIFAFAVRTGQFDVEEHLEAGNEGREGGGLAGIIQYTAQKIEGVDYRHQALLGEVAVPVEW